MANTTFLVLSVIVTVCLVAAQFLLKHQRRNAVSLASASAEARSINNASVLVQDEKAVLRLGADTEAAKETPDSPRELPAAITDCEAISRDDWVRRITDHVFAERQRSRYNVLTINTELDYHLEVGERVEEFTTTFTTRDGRKIQFYTVVFDHGDLTNFGDGGFINWCFEGHFDRVGSSSVTFRPVP